MLAAEIVFWACAALLVHTHVTYPLTLVALARLRRRPTAQTTRKPAQTPSVALVIAAHNEAGVIGRRVRNALAGDYPRERLEVIVTCDGCTDETVAEARAAGADEVLDLSRRGKVEAQNVAVASTEATIVAFSDANSMWAPDALGRLVHALSDPAVGYVCGQVRFSGDGLNQEGAYWRYEMGIRSLESQLGSITAGNGAIYAVRRADYAELDSDRGHDLCFPYLLVRRGMRALYVPEAQASEPMAPSGRGEFQRKRRMMNRTWGVLLRDRMLSPRGYPPVFAYAMLSHRGLRYLSPFLHVGALAANIALVGEGGVYLVTLAAQLALVAAGVAGRWLNARPFALANYYLAVTASIAVGLWDRVRTGPATTWEPVEGTR